MTVGKTGDAASVSAFAAELVRAAAVLEERRLGVARLSAELDCWTGDAADAFEGRLTRQAGAMGRAADALADCGRALQRYAVDLQEARVATARAQLFCAEHGLELDADVVRLPPGAYRMADAVAFTACLPQGQRLAESAEALVHEALARLSPVLADAIAAFRLVGAVLGEDPPGQTGHDLVER